MDTEVPLMARFRGRAILVLLGVLAAAMVFAYFVQSFTLARQHDTLEAPKLGAAMARVWRATDIALAERRDPAGDLITLHFSGMKFERSSTPGEGKGGAQLIIPIVRDAISQAPEIVYLWLERPLMEDRSLDLTLAGASLDNVLSQLALDLHEMGLPAIVSLPVRDGSWLVFRSEVYWVSRTTSVMMGLAYGAGLAILLSLAIFAALWLARPIELLAASASASRSDPSPTDLPTSGGSELATLAEVIEEGRTTLRTLLEDRTRMLAAISHDLRTPATRLKLRAEFIEDDVLREKILKDLDEMSEMIASALAFLRDDALREAEQLVSFSSILQSLCDDFADSGSAVSLIEAPPLRFETVGTVFGAHREARVFGEGRSLRMRGRPSSLRRAFANLIDNAVKYGERAEVTVHATTEEVFVEILDDGPGIPEEEIANVLKPFYRLESSRNRNTGGSGLGLAIVKSIIELHGGELELLNRVRGGLRVRVSLPRRL